MKKIAATVAATKKLRHYLQLRVGPKGVTIVPKSQRVIEGPFSEAFTEEVTMSRKKLSRKRPQHPIGTVAMYGPDDRTTTKIAAGVFLHEGAEAIIKRWVATDVTTNPKVQQELKDFFLQHGVKSVAMCDGNMGCPHEEGLDFPYGEDCPFCPFWKGKQGSNRKD